MAGADVGGRGDAVGDEQGIEFGGFGDLGQVFVVFEVQAGIGGHVRVAPCGDVVPGGHQECAEF